MHKVKLIIALLSSLLLIGCNNEIAQYTESVIEYIPSDDTISSIEEIEEIDYINDKLTPVPKQALPWQEDVISEMANAYKSAEFTSTEKKIIDFIAVNYSSLFLDEYNKNIILSGMNHIDVLLPGMFLHERGGRMLLPDSFWVHNLYDNESLTIVVVKHIAPGVGGAIYHIYGLFEDDFIFIEEFDLVSIEFIQDKNGKVIFLEHDFWINNSIRFSKLDIADFIHSKELNRGIFMDIRESSEFDRYIDIISGKEFESWDELSEFIDSFEKLECIASESMINMMRCKAQVINESLLQNQSLR